VVVDENEPVLLGDGPHADAGLRRDFLRVGDIHASAARRIEAPGVERTTQRALLHPAAEAEMSAEVRAEGIEDVCAPVLVAHEDQLAAQVVQRLHLADGQVLRVGDPEPAVGVRGVRKASHGLHRI
jgi:hypothetical protein